MLELITGGSLQDSMLVEGVAFKKTFSYAGFEQMTKSFDNPKIVLLNVELELKAERDNAEVRVSDVTAYQAVVDAEWGAARLPPLAWATPRHRPRDDGACACG